MARAKIHNPQKRPIQIGWCKPGSSVVQDRVNCAPGYTECDLAGLRRTIKNCRRSKAHFAKAIAEGQRLSYTKIVAAPEQSEPEGNDEDSSGDTSGEQNNEPSTLEGLDEAEALAWIAACTSLARLTEWGTPTILLNITLKNALSVRYDALS